jgi:hypothetical protein
MQPQVQAQARQRWSEARQREPLPTNYFHVVFTVPHELNGFARTRPVAYYNLLFAASSETLLVCRGYSLKVVMLRKRKSAGSRTSLGTRKAVECSHLLHSSDGS